MLAIAGAILINAACVLMASQRDTADVYTMRMALLVVGPLLMGVDIAARVREFFKKKSPDAGPKGAPQA